MAFTLPELPYPKDALAPHISAETMEYHYGRHHQTYVSTLNRLTEGKPEANASLEELIPQPTGRSLITRRKSGITPFSGSV